MKKSYFLFISLFLFTTLQAQIINFPDANFKAQLLKSDGVYSQIGYNHNTQSIRIDANGNGEIEVSEALNIYGLSLETYSNISDLTGIEYFSNLFFLNCNNNKLTALNVSSLVNLNYLRCNSNLLTELDVSGLKQLLILECYDNQLTSLKIGVLPKLNELKCSGNPLKSLAVAGCSNLNLLHCIGNQLNVLDLNGLTNLQEVHCANNKLTSLLLGGLASLRSLICENNLLTSLDVGGLSKLYSFHCSLNKLSTLDVSSLSSLFTLGCHSNVLTSLNISNSPNIVFLDCSKNQISSIIKSGFYKFISFNCSDNVLSALDLSDVIYGGNDGDYYLDNNQLTSLILKNGHGNGVTFANNPNLKYVCADEEEIPFIENLKNVYGNIDCNINSYCSFIPGGNFYTIQGSSKMDNDANGCDAADVMLPNLKFTVTSSMATGSIISNASGNYAIALQDGTHTITPVLENASYFTISPSSATITFPSQSAIYKQDFCITPNGSHPDLEVTVLPLVPARPGFDATYKIVYKNKGNAIQSGLLTFTYTDAVLDYVASIPVFSGQVLNSLSWDYVNLKPFESREIAITFNVNGPMEAPAVNDGDHLRYTATIASSIADETPSDNSFTLNQIVVNSLDPNDKTCLEGPVITPKLIGEYVHYIIRFENKGSYHAENIVVKDRIDLSKFDIATLIPTASSHLYSTKISDGNKVEFIFEHINLASDDANNDGYIAFKIKTIPSLVVGDSFTNEADIFFDYNFPIATNKATSVFKTLERQDFEFSDYFVLYPIPANDILNFTAKNSIEVKTIIVYNSLGQTVLAVPNTKSFSKIDVSRLKKGNYFIKIGTDKGTSHLKFIKN